MKISSRRSEPGGWLGGGSGGGGGGGSVCLLAKRPGLESWGMIERGGLICLLAWRWRRPSAFVLFDSNLQKTF